MDQRKLPPGPKGTFLFGNALQIFRNPLDLAVQWAREYGDVVRFHFGKLPFYMLCHPEDIEYVLRGNHRNFSKDRGTQMLSSLLGKGLLTSEGELWKRQRRLAQPGFQLEQVQAYGEVMVAFAERMIQGWQAGETRDVHADLMRLTLEIVAQTLFSANVGGYAERVSRDMDAITRYFASMQAMIPWLQKLPTPANRRYKSAVSDLDAIIYETIARRRTDGRSGTDLLGRFLAAHDDDGNGMTDKQLRDEVVTLFLAGHETTALALSFTFYLLAMNPDADARLAAELEEVLGGRRPTVDVVPCLRYAEWVVRESMRVLPPVPSIGREAVADCEIRGFHVPKGTQISLAQWIVHRDPRWYDDPEAFRPERWDNDLARRLPRGAYFPFGDGPRICIGNQFAMMEAVLILAAVAQRFRLELSPGYRLQLLPSVTLRPKHGVRLTIRERSGGGGSPALDPPARSEAAGTHQAEALAPMLIPDPGELDRSP